MSQNCHLTTWEIEGIQVGNLSFIIMCIVAVVCAPSGPLLSWIHVEGADRESQTHFIKLMQFWKHHTGDLIKLTVS